MPEERKLATVLFADIVQSSEVTAAHDPEVVRRTLTGIFARMREVLVAHGGTVEKFIGDAVMTVFGIPFTHDDDAERAVRAAVALRRVVADLPPAPAIQLRIGINSGEVVTGDDERAPTLVTGSPVIVAARLQQSAAPGEILVGELTRRLAGERVRYGAPRRIAAKGIGPVQAAPVEDVVGGPGRASAGTSPFIGRRREIALLERARDDARASARPRLAVVLGPAGVGKSRLVDELVRATAPAHVLTGHCLPYGDGITLWPLQEIVRESARIAPTDTPHIARAKLENAAREVLSSDVAAPVVDRLSALIAAEGGAFDIGPEDAQRAVAAALAPYIEALSRSAPDVPIVVLEDLHLAQPALLSILESVLAHVHAPLLLVAIARPELRELHSAWLRAQYEMSVIELAPLTRAQSERLTRSLLKDLDVDAETIAELVARAEGNPLFLEELAHVVREHGDPASVPPTLLAVIAARLDALDPAVKQLIQRASVLGRDFWLDALPEEGAIGDAVAGAEERDLVKRVGRPGPSGTPTYRFRHVLIREVAYASTPKAQRMRLHDHVARWLRTAAGERVKEYVDIVAHHAEQAFHAARQIEDSEASALGRRAFEALLDAAIAARDRADFRASLALATRALDVAREVPIESSARTKALGIAAIMRLRLEPSREALELLDRAIDTARSDGPSEHLVRMLVWRAQIVMAEDVAAAHELFDETVRHARALRDDELVTYALWVSGQAVEVIGALRAQADVLAEAYALMTRTGADRWLIDTLTDLSANALHRSDAAGALARATEADAIARERGTRLQRYKARIALARAQAATGDIDGALHEASDAFVLARELGGPWALAEGAETLGELHLARGDGAAAARVLELSSAELDPATMPAMRGRIARVRSLLARAYLASGKTARAEAAANAARLAAPDVDVRAGALARAALAQVAAARGRREDALRLIDDAVSLVERTDYRALSAQLREERADLANAHVRRLTV